MSTYLQSCFEDVVSKYLISKQDNLKQNNLRQDEIKQITLVVAYSGGLDSTCLLLLAHQFAVNTNVSLKAVHINHQISSNAHSWQQHCAQQCLSLNVPFEVVTVSIESDGESLEAVARDKRYRAIAAVTKPDDVILLGQHKDDQAETMLLQLLRGAGPQGLSSMAEYSVNTHGSQLLRPLLNFTKQELVTFVSETGIEWVEDESNLQSQYDRNFLRHEILPKITERWPGAVETISRSVRHIQSHEKLLQEQVALQYRKVVCEDLTLSISVLNELSRAWQRQVLKYWIKQKGHQQPSENILVRIIEDSLQSQPDAQPKVTWGGWQCCRFKNRLYLFPIPKTFSESSIPVTSEETKLPVDMGSILLVDFCPKESGFREIKADLADQVNVEFGGFSRVFKPENEPHSKPLKQWFKQWNIPIWERTRTPLLVFDNEIIAVGDIVRATNNSDSQTKVSTYYYKWIR